MVVLSDRRLLIRKSIPKDDVTEEITADDRAETAEDDAAAAERLGTSLRRSARPYGVVSTRIPEL